MLISFDVIVAYLKHHIPFNLSNYSWIFCDTYTFHVLTFSSQRSALIHWLFRVILEHMIFVIPEVGLIIVSASTWKTCLQLH